MCAKKNGFRKIYIEGKKDLTVGFGKYAPKTLGWTAKNDIEYFKQIKDLYYKKYNYFKKKEYDRLSILFFKNISLYVDQKPKIIDFIVTNKKAGLRFVPISDFLRKDYPGIAQQLLNECIQGAKDLLKQEFEIEKDFLVDLHILRYEELFNKACDPDLTKVPPAYRDSVLAENYLTAVEILTQKEKMLGIHSKTFKVQINNFLKAKNQAAKPTLNFDILSFKEQVELLQLIKATQVNDLVPITSSMKQEEVQQVVIKKEIIEAPIRQVEQTDIIAEEEKLVLKQGGKTIIDIQTTMRENVKRQVEEAFKKQKQKK